jgi:hypothetical protein
MARICSRRKIALRFGDGRGDVALNFRAERQHFMLAVEHGQQLCQPISDRSRLQQLLTIFEIEIQICGDQVREMAGVFGVQCGDFDLLESAGESLMIS